MGELVLVRHGQSVWNLQNRFTGWIDIGLSEKGKEEANSAGVALKDMRFDEVHVSHMFRAIQTMERILSGSSDERTPMIFHPDDEVLSPREVHGAPPEGILPVYMSKLLAERCYGALQGLNKKETADMHGADQVQVWRRSFDVNPPDGESLKDTLARVLPYYSTNIVPRLKAGKKLLVVAHGNSLRAMSKYLEDIPDDRIVAYEIATGSPIHYVLDENLGIVSKTNLV